MSNIKRIEEIRGLVGGCNRFFRSAFLCTRFKSYSDATGCSSAGNSHLLGSDLWCVTCYTLAIMLSVTSQPAAASVWLSVAILASFGVPPPPFCFWVENKSIKLVDQHLIGEPFSKSLAFVGSYVSCMKAAHRIMGLSSAWCVITTIMPLIAVVVWVVSDDEL